MTKPFVPSPLPTNRIEWIALLPWITKAHAELARFDGFLESLINPDILLTPLSRREAVLSSKIEGTEATLEEVLTYEAEPRPESTPKHSDIQEILNYHRAMSFAQNKLEKRPISLNLVKDLHHVLMDSVRGHNRGRGELRTVQNWIGPPGCTIEEAIYIPPPFDKLPETLDNFEKYIHCDERDPLVQIALIHAQFELIHPFVDGNGRVGRILIPLFLFEKELISRPAFYLSAFLEANRDEYYGLLQMISSSGDLDDWIIFFLKAIAEQAIADTNRARQISSLYEEMKQEIARITRSQFAVQALDTMFAWPVFGTPQFAERSGIPKMSASRMLNQLDLAKVIKVLRRGLGRRPTIYSFPRLLDIVR